jgi:hypothetical protein
MKLRGPPRTPTRSTRAVIGSTQPVRCLPPLGSSTNAPAVPIPTIAGLDRLAALLELPLFSRARSPGPRAVPPTPTRRQTPAWRTTLPLLDFPRPTTQSRAGRSVRRQIPLPPRTACGVWLPPARHPPPALPTLSRRSVHGLHPSRTSPRPRSVPLSGPIPSWRYPPVLRPPEGRRGAMRPTSGSCSRDEFVLSPEPRVIPAVDSFLGFRLPELSHVRPGARFDRGASPLALRRLDVQARLGLRVLRCERVERSVSGPPTLLGFSTFRPPRCSVHRSSGRAYRFASRRRSP